ncbi:MAG: hypothetical protein M1409_10555 [Actinobacteria bacterium]|nr:hypothetical protein [Actinomycetota bacterium]
MSKKILGVILALVIVLVLTIGVACSLIPKQTNQAVSKVSQSQTTPYTVEIFYLTHAPAVAIVKKVEPIIAEFPKFQVKEYSFDDPAAKDLINKYNLTEHMPIAIFIGGKDTFEIGGKKIELKNFPKGDAFVPDFEGNWSYEDLRSVLKSIS